MELTTAELAELHEEEDPLRDGDFSDLLCGAKRFGLGLLLLVLALGTLALV